MATGPAWLSIEKRSSAPFTSNARRCAGNLSAAPDCAETRWSGSATPVANNHRNCTRLSFPSTLESERKKAVPRAEPLCQLRSANGNAESLPRRLDRARFTGDRGHANNCYNRASNHVDHVLGSASAAVNCIGHVRADGSSRASNRVFAIKPLDEKKDAKRDEDDADNVFHGVLGLYVSDRPARASNVPNLPAERVRLFRF
jgi:hypothetical protein